VKNPYFYHKGHKRPLRAPLLGSEYGLVFKPMSSSVASSNPNSIIQFQDVSYALGSQVLLSGITLSVVKGETLVLLGRSGAGKTTTLRLINRLLAPTTGDIIISGRSTSQWDLIALRRSMGWVIQDTGLFPHYSVEKNVAIVPRLEGWPADRVRARVLELLQLVGLEMSFGTRYPHQLSGGQRQRVGVARALAADPQILLMDEPFGALDPITRAELQKQFTHLQQRLRKTVVMVTHDLHEALRLGTRIALFEAGSLIGVFGREEFANSANRHVLEYMNLFHAALPN
jgi:osmoprotectant transport system ATP-binding protein